MSDAAATVSMVLNSVSSTVDRTSSQFYTQLANAMRAAGSNTNMVSAKLLQVREAQGVNEFSVPFGNRLSIADVRNIYGEEVAKIADDLGNSFNQFLEDNFPSLGTYVEAAEEWINRALDTGPGGGGTGVNEDVERQIWLRDRQRIADEAARTGEEAMTQFAARGFVIPPGALVHRLAVIDREAQEKIGESSRARAIKTFETELENTRLALGRALDLRSGAIVASMEYMKALVLASSQQGTALTAQAQTAQQQLNSALTELYKADLAGKGFNLQYRVADATFEEHVRKAAFDSAEVGRNAAITAAVAALQGLSQQASSALNGLHAQGSATDSITTSTSA